MSDPGLDTPYWSQDAAALSASVGVGPGGLSSERAAAQLRLVGPNSVEDASRLSALRLLLRQFESPLVLILIFAAAISLVLQQWVDAGHHSGDRARKHAARLLSGVPGVGGGRGAEAPPGADLPRHAGRRRADGARQHYRARRPHPALGRQSDPGRWPRDRGGGLPGQRSEHDGRVLPGREAAGDREAGGGPLRLGPMQSFSAPRSKAARRRSSPSKPVAGPRSARSRHGSEPARPRRISRAACASSDIC